MAAVIRTFVRYYHILNEELADPRTNDWFLIRTPFIPLAIVLFYVHFVSQLGPNIMAKRKPFNLDRIMQIYNAMQICLSALILFKGGYYWAFRYQLVCEPIDFSLDPEALDIARTVWYYYMIKLFDLLDTVFFVLRKKQNQVSFLHVYHHAGMVLATWGATKYLPGGHVTLLGLINSFVHVIMYVHYLLTSLKWGKPWWKKYITQLQLAQFAILMVHFSELLLVKDCDFPRWPAFILLPQNTFMIVLFGDFYYKTYIKKPERTVATKLERNGSTTVEKIETIGETEKIQNRNGKPKAH